MLRVKVLSGAVSATTNTSVATIRRCDHVTVQTVATGASSASYAQKLQSSLDGSNWDDISGATATITTDGSSSISVVNSGFPYIRSVFTRSTGSFTDLTVRVSGKERETC